MYGTFEHECEADPTSRPRSSFSAAGRTASARASSSTTAAVTPPSRCATRATETVMINCNPETVSTDYDTADRLYFEPLTFEDVMAVIEREKSAGGDVVVRGAVRRPDAAEAGAGAAGAGVRILGTSPDSIDLAEDRERFAKLLWELGIPQAASGMARSPDEARDVAASIGFPVVVRPSYVLGGRAMAIVYDTGALDRYMRHAVQASPEHPILIDKFLEDAFEFDVDARRRRDRRRRDRRHHGAHRGGRHSLGRQLVRRAAVPARERHLATIRDYTRRIARALKVIGLMNVQYAIKDDVVYVLEVNPRASRTVPYLQGDRRAAGEGGRARDGRPDAGRAGASPGPRGLRLLRQDARVSVRALPGRRHDSRPGDEVHRRSHGRRRDVRVGASPRRRWAPASGCRNTARRSSA